MYLKRQLEEKINLLSQNFKIILILGARQVGKSTILKHLFPDLQCIVFDPTSDRFGARADPDLFLANFPSPIILDEVQYVPEVLSAIKRCVDEKPDKGQYFLTGSHNLMLLKQVAESMAGRVGIIELSPLSIYELKQIDAKSWLSDYLQDSSKILGHKIDSYKYTLYETIWRGGMPGIIDFANQVIPDYFRSYIQTYLERDVRVVEYVNELSLFAKFMGILANLTSQEINHSQLGRELGLSAKTVSSWINIMETCYQWHEILPYHGNAIKRLSKKPKGYITDTGIACYLQYVSEPIALASHPSLGALFETWVVNQIIIATKTLAIPPRMYHWRTINNAEVDIILEYNNRLYPIEIKCKTNLNRHDARGIIAFRETYPNLNIATGLIIYAGDIAYRVNQDVIAMPWSML